MNNNRPLVDRLREALALPKIGPCFTSADFTTPEDVGITKENARLAPLHEAVLTLTKAVELVLCDGDETEEFWGSSDLHKAYADRSVALCRKLESQRNHFADGWNEFLPFDEAIAPFDAELAAIAKGGAK